MDLLELPPYFSYDMPYIDKWKIISNAPVKQHAWCLRHCRYCPVRASDVNASGPPCVDFSNAGLGAGVEGSTNYCMLALCRIHTWFGTKLAVVENTPRCPLQYVQMNLPSHTVQRLDVSCADTGFGLVGRDRAYFVATHNARTRIVFNIQQVYNYVSQKLYVATRPHHALQADAEEMREEEQELCETRKVPPKT